jgi:hypothetical protein
MDVGAARPCLPLLLWGLCGVCLRLYSSNSDKKLIRRMIIASSLQRLYGNSKYFDFLNKKHDPNYAHEEIRHSLNYRLGMAARLVALESLIQDLQVAYVSLSL